MTSPPPTPPPTPPTPPPPSGGMSPPPVPPSGGMHPHPPPPHHHPPHFGGGGGFYNPGYRFWDDWSWFNRPVYVVDTPKEKQEQMNYLPLVLIGGVATVALIVALNKK